MTVLTRPERLALLLNLLGDDAKTLARTGLQGEALLELENAIADFEQFPPSRDEIEIVLQDFESYFDLAMNAAEKELEEEQQAEDFEPKILEIPEEHFDVALEPTRRFERPKLTGNIVHDLNRLHPYQVAQSLREEPADVIAIVIRELANEHAAKTLEYMPEAMRPAIFLRLAQPTNVTETIQTKILEVTLEMALKVEERQTVEESSAKMANLVRSMPKSLRSPMLEELANKDSDLAEAVKKLLYRFEDLERLEDRDMQKVLGNCRTETLVVALQQVEESLLNRVLGNMSKRAKEALQEEMEYQAGTKPEEIEASREAIVQVLAELDEAGTISID